MSTVLVMIFMIACLSFMRAVLITLGYYKEPVLSAFQQYGDEVGFSPLLDMILWGSIMSYLVFVVIVPSSMLILFGVVALVLFIAMYWQVKDNIMNYPAIFLQYPRWYRDIVDHTSREERRKISYMWLGLPFKTRLLYNAREDAFRKWVELVVISVA
jgi:hypothetical protein